MPAATLEGNARGIGLRVMPGDDGVFIQADRQVLTGVVMNLLQNAFKFTKPGTMVVLTVRTSVERVLVARTNAEVSRVGVSMACSARSSNAAGIEAVGPWSRLQPTGR